MDTIARDSSSWKILKCVFCFFVNNFDIMLNHHMLIAPKFLCEVIARFCTDKIKLSIPVIKHYKKLRKLKPFSDNVVGWCSRLKQ
jgi:hypothetical protein